MSDLVIKNVSKIYDSGIAAVRDFNLEIKNQDFVIFVGPSGCGKSTMLRMIAGLEEVTNGEIWIDGKLMNFESSKNRDLAMVFQNYALYPYMTVYDNLAFSLKIRNLPRNEIDVKVKEVARILQIEKLLKRKPRELSGGQKQRVAIGSAIVREPKIFLMDEPMSNLDAKLRGEMRLEIAKLHKNLKSTFIYVTHDQIEAMALGTKIVVMKDGMIQQVASPSILYDYPRNIFVADFIGSPPMNFIKAKVIAKNRILYLEFNYKKMKLREHLSRILFEKGYLNETIIIGIRPKDIQLVTDISEKKDDTIIIYPYLRELLGADAMYYFDIENQNCCMSVAASYELNINEAIEVTFNQEKMNLFDENTQENILFINESISWEGK